MITVIIRKNFLIIIIIVIIIIFTLYINHYCFPDECILDVSLFFLRKITERLIYIRLEVVMHIQRIHMIFLTTRQFIYNQS